MLLIEIVLLYAAFLNISKIALKKHEVLISICVTEGVLCLIFYIGASEFGVLTIVANCIYVLIFTILAYIKIKNLPLSLVYALIADIITLLSGNIISVVIVAFGISRELTIGDPLLYFISIIIVFPINYFISLCLGNFIKKKLAVFNDILKKKFALYIILSAVFTFALFCVNNFLTPIIDNPGLINLLYVVVLAAMFFYMVFAIYTFTNILNKDIVMLHKDEMLANLNVYTSGVEDIATEMRRFKHDHINILKGVRSYICDNDMDGVRTFFEKYTNTFTNSSNDLNSMLDMLKNIKIPELKSILALKFAHAKEAGIDVHIEANETLDCDTSCFDLIDLCRTVGILLDNAMEAAVEVRNAADNDKPPPVIKFVVIKKKKNITMLLFANSCKQPPPIPRIFKKGFTTKDNKRGLGLSIVQSIMDKNENIKLNTYTEGNMFTQELLIL
jgi:two-component system sensor histidine kinase AgrC